MAMCSLFVFSAFVEAEAWQVGAYTPGGNYLAYNEHHLEPF